jgi:hypothetical protein
MAQTYRPKPTLDECRSRVIRAEEHIKRLERELAAIASPVTRWTRHDSIGQLIQIGAHIPSIVRILIGETLYDLRTALDYLASQLFYLATGRFDSRTKFLIEISPTAWNRHLSYKNAWLPSLARKHQTMLERFQPFNGHKCCGRFKRFLTLTAQAFFDRKTIFDHHRECRI